MEFDAVLIPPRRESMVRQGHWRDRTINDDLADCLRLTPDKTALVAHRGESGEVTRMTYREVRAWLTASPSACTAWACAATTWWPASCPTGGSSR